MSDWEPSHEAIHKARETYLDVYGRMIAPRDTTNDPYDASWGAMEAALTVAYEVDGELSTEPALTQGEVGALLQPEDEIPTASSEAARASAKAKLRECR